MKCPKCEKQNRVGLSHCLYCGSKLPEEPFRPSWLDSFDGTTKTTKYYSIDDQGNEVESQDNRDVFADRMQSLKYRQQQGEILKKEFRKRQEERQNRRKSQIIDLSQNPENYSDYQHYHRSNSENNEHILDEAAYQNLNRPSIRKDSVKIKKSRAFSKLVLILLSAIASISLVLLIYFFVSDKLNNIADKADKPQVKIIPSILNDLAAHTILIPAEEGEQIYIKELHKSYLVTNGYAHVEVADYTWYENYEDYVSPSMDVSLSPYIRRTNGKHIPLDQINYTVDIPLSPISIVSPQNLRDTAYTQIYRIEIKVRENSKLWINGENYSDIVNTDNGLVTYNAPLKPIGDNVFEITCKAQYCRSNKISVVINRPKQEIPIDLSADLSAVSDYPYMTVRASTVPGAYVLVQTPHTDLDISNINKDGSFSFKASFNKIGDNEIRFTASKGNAPVSEVKFNVYYVPDIDKYSRSAWAMDDNNYNHLIATIGDRVKNSQKYVCIGTIEEFLAQDPQLAIFNCGTDEKPIRILVENKTKRTWQFGKSYRLYADAFGMYKDMPRLTARYTYSN